MPSLCPGIPLRRSEQHLVRRILRLTDARINRKKEGEIEADLATTGGRLIHCAEHLRPAVLWHDGQELTRRRGLSLH